MPTNRFILRQKSPTAATADELSHRLTINTRFRVLDKGPVYLFVAGDQGLDVLANEARDGWSIIPEIRYELPERPLAALRPPSPARSRS